MTVTEMVIISFFAGAVLGIIIVGCMQYLSKKSLWSQGFDDGWAAHKESIEEEARERNKE